MIYARPLAQLARISAAPNRQEGASAPRRRVQGEGVLMDGGGGDDANDAVSTVMSDWSMSSARGSNQPVAMSITPSTVIFSVTTRLRISNLQLQMGWNHEAGPLATGLVGACRLLVFLAIGVVPSMSTELTAATSTRQPRATMATAPGTDPFADVGSPGAVQAGHRFIFSYVIARFSGDPTTSSGVVKRLETILPNCVLSPVSVGFLGQLLDAAARGNSSVPPPGVRILPQPIGGRNRLGCHGRPGPRGCGGRPSAAPAPHPGRML
jgi:hypothetical protein